MGPQRLNYIEAQTYFSTLALFLAVNKNQRKGQVMFNVLHDLFPALANAEVRAKNVDPFYQTSGFEYFFKAILSKEALENETVQARIVEFG